MDATTVKIQRGVKRVRTKFFLTLLLGFAAFASLTATAQATPRIDCPLRNQLYSIDTPLMDILLKPEAMATLERFSPGIRQRIPERFLSTQAPSFSAIVTLRLTAGMRLFAPDTLPQLDAALRALPVTRADRQARCARYDVERPNFAMPTGRPRLLLFEKMTGFRDGPSVEAAHAAFVDMAARNGWGLVTADRGGAITPEILRNIDVVIWNNVSGDVLTQRQRRALKRYMEQGGGFVAVHGSGGDPAYFWDWYADTLIGARFMGHPLNPQFQTARIVVNGTDSAIGRDLAPGWTMTDEWYSFRASPRATGATIIATLDESTYTPEGMGGSLRMGDHPIAWSRCVGSGRAFYSAIGHRPEGYSEPHYVRLLEQAIRWASDTNACARP